MRALELKLDELAGLCEGLDLPAYWVDRYGFIQWATSAALQRLGWPEGLWQGRRISEMMPQSRIFEVLAGGQSLRCRELTYIGETIQISYQPCWRDGELLGVWAVIEQQEKSCLELEEEEIGASRLLIQMYETLLGDLLLGLAVVDSNGVIITVNKYWEKLFGVNLAEIQGMPLKTLFPESHMGQVLATGQPRIGETWTRDDEVYFLSELPLRCGELIIGGLVKLVPVENVETRDLVARYQLLERKLLFYQSELSALKHEEDPFVAIIGENPHMVKVKNMARKVARGDATVLILGESGTGKEVLAQAIHRASPRADQPFISINCAAIPENLLEAELFGYEEGAFTGAVKGGKAGKFELAHGGTIFLDEIGDMPLAMQAKILRALQERQIVRVGGYKPIPVDVRLIAATNRDLVAMMQAGEFRSDLYYRLSVITLQLPPLRERRDDIPALVKMLIEKFNKKYLTSVEGYDKELERFLLSYSWPGNVRQLENVLEYAFNMLEPGQKLLTLQDLPEQVTGGGPLGENDLRLETVVARAERKAILQALQATRGNRMEAARLLGIQRSAFYQKLKKYGLSGKEEDHD